MPIDVKVARRHLASTIRFAKSCEEAILRDRLKKPLGALTYATLISQRRLAAAIHRLGLEGSFEARILLRSMVEHHYNLSWVRLKSPHRRANRFIKFHALNRLLLMEALPPHMQQANHAQVIAGQRALRTSHRRLFRVWREAKKKWVWTESWCGGLSFRQRVEQVEEADKTHIKGEQSPAYALYKLFSGPTHGSAEHLFSLMEHTRNGARPKEQPDQMPEAVTISATVMLLGALMHASQVLGFSREMDEKWMKLKSAVESSIIEKS